jgi:hypothetical protein
VKWHLEKFPVGKDIKVVGPGADPNACVPGTWTATEKQLSKLIERVDFLTRLHPPESVIAPFPRLLLTTITLLLTCLRHVVVQRATMRS